MIRSLFTGASGLKGHQTRMDVIGNNISNVNTVGFKSGRMTFEDMLSQKMKDASASNGNIGSTNPYQVGLGVQTGSIDTIFKDGAPVVTGKNTDLCLSGDGLFVVKHGNDTYYTRDGAFSFDAEGNYVLPGSGHFVQGWMAKDGIIDTTSGTEDIKIPFGKELIGTTNKTITEISTVPDQMNISFGGKQFRVGGVPNDGRTWTYKDDVPLGATTAEIVDENGNTATVTLSPAATFEVPKGQNVVYHTDVLTKGSVTEQYPFTVSLDGRQYTVVAMDADLNVSSDWGLKSGAAVGSDTITLTDGTNDVTLTLDSPLKEAIGETGLTQAVASQNHPVTLTFSDGTTAVMTDGTYETGASVPVTGPLGTLQSVELDASGIITGIYSNGARRPEAQVAVAHFDNSAGLVKKGTSLYQESDNSGAPTIIKAGDFGVTITPGELEMSNVDVAEEFSNMIITQRGFQSNSKIITVGDEMVKTAIDMKR